MDKEKCCYDNSAFVLTEKNIWMQNEVRTLLCFILWNRSKIILIRDYYTYLIRTPFFIYNTNRHLQTTLIGEEKLI